MERKRYERLDETLYREKLPNGLEVCLLPKPGFSKTYAMFSARFGSVDSRYRLGAGDETQVPDGAAHFLEHKLFEDPEGNTFARFADRGASVNAFTTFDRTSYLFSATEELEANTEHLLDMVQQPYFTDENVEKEKGIIGQEIRMYQDDPEWRAFFGLIESLYAFHPVRIDIAGTVESISAIGKETLYDLHRTFYHPGNMLLFMAGGFDPEQVMRLVRANQERKVFPATPDVRRILPEEPDRVVRKEAEISLDVSMPKCKFGFKEPAGGLSPEEKLRRELTTALVLDLIFGQSASIYQTLYDEKLITDQFGYEYDIGPGYAFSVIGGDTPDPGRLIGRVRELIGALLDSGIDADEFERVKRKRIGGYLRKLNSPEGIASEFTRYRFMGIDYFELLPVLERITLRDAERRLGEHVNWDRSAVFVVRPKEAP